MHRGTNNSEHGTGSDTGATGGCSNRTNSMSYQHVDGLPPPCGVLKPLVNGSFAESISYYCGKHAAQLPKSPFYTAPNLCECCSTCSAGKSYTCSHSFCTDCTRTTEDSDPESTGSAQAFKPPTMCSECTEQRVRDWVSELSECSGCSECNEDSWAADSTDAPIAEKTSEGRGN
ncbi:unnamed protein product [Gongylonema pulchrum]|uniref:TNFR-Cys domain-containing protein n=1 Tax=Gongylonema pulchrum TaxID=637853 RepID=A0A183D5Y4_9BILA|nr:unnamed protein product [Gongylonema pulchrum]